MRKLFFMKCLAGIAMLLLGFNAARAGVDPPVVKVLDGSMGHLVDSAAITVEDAKFFDSAYAGRLRKPYSIQNLVSFEFNEGVPVYLRDTFTATVRVRITTTAANNTTSSIDTVFQLEYSSTGTYRHRVTYAFANSYRTEVRILSLTKSVSWNVWAALKIVNQLQAFPQYNFYRADAVGQVSDSAWTASSFHDELPVWWPPLIGADEYDLEWTYIDSSSLRSGLYGDSTNPNATLLFNDNASRVSVTGTAYRIPLLYDSKGTLFYRVRGVQWQAGGGRNEAVWTTFNTAGHGRFAFNGHQDSLNWQATTSFAEEGKRKSVVQYYDGSLRGRQTVTKDNTVNRTIVAESFYDYQGRPVINVLPAPTLNTIIGYSKGFNRGFGSAEYDKNQFDTLSSPGAYCSLQASPMDTVSGASQYYSSNSPFRDSGVHKYVPNAEKFPFTETEYTQDNTGRINRQGGVGNDFRLGSGHETKYMYSTPGQRELDALFGTEVGDKSHYFKNLVRDANGQYSISYVDMRGRTIATALAGTPPADIKLEPLASNNVAMRTEAIASPASVVIKDLVMEHRKSLAVYTPGNYDFSYSLNPQILKEEGCNMDSVCYDCLYDLEITITDDCNNQNLPKQKAFDTVFHNFSLNSIDTTCNAGTGFNITFGLALSEGNYEITKKLSVSRYGMDYLRDSVFMLKNTCRNLDSFVAAQRAILAHKTECVPSCKGCTDSLGTWSDYWVRFRQNNGIPNVDTAAYRNMALEAYQVALDECAALCDTLSGAASIRQNMLMDMTPSSGQYANISNGNDKYSVFYSRLLAADDNQLKDTLARYTLVTDYKDEDGNLDRVFDEGAGRLVPPQALTPEVFAQRFKSSWAGSLLRYHPEYNKLVNYEKLTLSHEWDKQFEATDTYAEAKKKGYLNPVNSTAVPFNLFTGVSGSIAPDPLATLLGEHFLDSLKRGLQFYLHADNYGDVSMWQMASVTVMCQGTSTIDCYNLYKTAGGHPFDTAYMCAGELDMAWRAFRQMYLDTKRRLVNKYINTDCSNCMTTAAIIASGHQPNFTDAQEIVALQAPADLPPTREAAEAIRQQYYESNCKAYAALWLNELAPCTLYDSAHLSVIIPALTDICLEGADSTHPYGSSSVKPSSPRTLRSFEAYLANYNATHGITDALNCNGYKITAPKPYDQQAMNGNKPLYSKPDDCECTNISRLYTKYLPKAAGYSTFSNYLKQVYQTDISDSVLTLLLKFCHLGGLTADCDYVSQPIYLPSLFQCNTNDVCVDCEKFSALDAEFKQLYPTVRPNVADSVLYDSVQLAKNTLYEQFMNYRLGFSKTVDDYVNFKSQCAASGNTACDSLQAILDSFYVNRQTDYGMKAVFGTVEGETFTNSAAIEDGIVKLPDSVRQRPGSWFNNFQLTQNPGLKFCWTNGYSIESRVKFLANTNNEGIMGIGNINVTYVIQAFNAFTQNGVSYPSGVYLVRAEDHRGHVYGAETHNVFDYLLVDSNINAMYNWNTVKSVVFPHYFRFYYNNRLIVEIPRDSADGVNTALVYTLQFSGRQGAVDWVKMYDQNSTMKYFEEFLDGNRLIEPDPSFYCQNNPPDCNTSFVQFFNQKKGTSYSGSQVDSLYFATCGKLPDVCVNNAVLQNIANNFKINRQQNYGVVVDYETEEHEHFSDLQDLVVNGAVQLPDTIRQRPATSFNNFGWHLSNYKTFCSSDGYAVEARMRFLTNNYYLFYANFGQISCNFRYCTGDCGSGPGLYLYGLTDYYPTPVEFGEEHGNNGFSSVLATSQTDLTQWFTVKLQITPARYYIYCNGRLVIDLPRNSANPIANFGTAGLGMQGRQGAIDWWKVYDANGKVRYFEDYLDADNPTLPDPAYFCPTAAPDCQTSFTQYFNQQRGTNYTFPQIESLYHQVTGSYPNVCVDATPTCDKLNNLLTDYNKQYVSPDSRVVELPMRTFAGNRTPAEGPKGVFDVNGNLIGRTSDGTPAQIDTSFANIWNSNLANQQVGSLTALPNGLFRLQLNPGQQTPCGGIVGMRYYQFETNTKDSLRDFQTGRGSYIDFGDNTLLKAERALWDNKNRVFEGKTFGYYLTNRFVMGNDFTPHTFHTIWHYYPPSSQLKTYTVTVYHSDTLGVVAFKDFRAYGDTTQFANIRGYFPQNLWLMGFYGTHDSTINRTSQIRNFNQISSIEWFEAMGSDYPVNQNVFMHNNFGSFANNHNLKRIRIDIGYSFLPNYQQPGVVDAAAGNYFHDVFPELNKNFRDLRLVIFNAWYQRESDLYQFNFELPKLRLYYNAFVNLYNGYNDTVYNQLARVAVRDSGVVSLGYGATTTYAPGAASATSRNYLTNDKHWKLSDYPFTANGGYTGSNIITNDSVVVASQFTEFINQKLGTNYSYQQVRQLYTTCGNQLDDCNKPLITSDLTLCGRAEPVFPVIALEAIDNCSDSTFFIQSKSQDLFSRYTDSVKGRFDSSYRAKCMQAYKYERFTVRHYVGEYHYTLYYYDQGGNLVKTIPPAGVKPIYDSLWLDSVDIDRKAGLTRTPAHLLPTQYRYNTLNQVIAQQSPDGGKTMFWYDRLGRLVLSRNARQLAMGDVDNHYYSYTKYDVLGRITEVGQLRDTLNKNVTDSFTRNETQLTDWYTSLLNNREQVTATVYDTAYDFGPFTPDLVVAQQNLRNRVSFTGYSEIPGVMNKFNHRTYYSYDIHGNVDTLLQDYGREDAAPNIMNKNGNRFKRFVYEYDLISGKVNKVTYQPGVTDQWIHRYYYDAENRLTEVETSVDGYGWDREAKYEYYLHGPLARTTLGQQQVQGIDYAYTLQGWLKGVNSTGGTSTYDIGGDGKSSSINQYTARDAYGFNLNYFGGDYKPVNPGVTPFPVYRLSGGGLHDSAYRPLYNGNISSMGVYIHKLEVTNGSGGILYAYKYDQLNRLVQQDAFAGFNRNSNAYPVYPAKLETYGQTFQEAISYDANGNIQTYNRNGISKAMDRLTYHYYPGTNQLKHVNDAVPATEYGTSDNEKIIDIDNQPDSNYSYDAIGNLIRDSSEGNTRIKWNVYGKITEITRTPSVTAKYSKISYSYDAQGNRIGKVTTGGNYSGRMDYTWYVRDAQGNVMGVYTARDDSGHYKSNLQDLELDYTEQHIYGSSRLGVYSDYVIVHGGTLPQSYFPMRTYYRGKRMYELSNHLGNVLSTISDKKFGVPLNDTAVSYYEPDILAAYDYYPFGMPNRVLLAPTNQYRFGFNGKENDVEAKGWMNQQDYGMRIYDPRLGRFLSVDPIAADYPWYTPYQFSGNTPIQAVDLDGLEEEKAITISEEKAGQTAMRVVWKEGNGKVVQMVKSEAMGTKVFKVALKLGGGPLNLIRHIFSSPSTSSQDVARQSYPRLGGTQLEDKFWERWIGPGRNFPLPPINGADRAQWLSEYWPEGMAINLPNAGSVPQVDTKPVNDDEDETDDGYITLYRGVGEDIRPIYLYDLAKKGTAWPKGLLPGVPEASINTNANRHTGGDNVSIWTSWTSDKSMAEYFARGPMGTSNGVVLSKRFKRSQLTVSGDAKLMQEGEYLVPGIVTGASTEILDARNRKR